MKWLRVAILFTPLLAVFSIRFDSWMDFHSQVGDLKGPTFGGRAGAIDWLELPSLHLARRVMAGFTDLQLPLTREGMAIHKDQLLFLPEDEPSRLFIFPKTTSP